MLSLNDDGEYFGRIVAFSEEVRFVPEAISYYRQANVASISNTVTHKGCESLFLSIKLSIGYLLALENSERTRAAALQYLQTYLIYFYPEERDILGEMAELAAELGGNLSPPELKEKYALVRKIFGWPSAKNLVFTVPRLKKRMFGGCDRLMSVFAGSGRP
jgi:hypothetical protein